MHVIRGIFGGVDGGTDETAGERKVLRVEGRGVVSADPDQVVLTFGVEGLDESYGVAVDELNRRVEALRGDPSEAAGLGRELPETLSFDVGPEYDYEDGGRRFRGYNASHRLRVELPLEKDLMNRALDRVAGSASEATLGVSFDVSDRHGLKRKALRAAVEDARYREGLGRSNRGEDRGDRARRSRRVGFGGSAAREFEGFRRRRDSVDPDIEPGAIRAVLGRLLPRFVGNESHVGDVTEVLAPFAAPWLDADDHAFAVHDPRFDRLPRNGFPGHARHVVVVHVRHSIRPPSHRGRAFGTLGRVRERQRGRGREIQEWRPSRARGTRFSEKATRRSPTSRPS